MPAEEAFRRLVAEPLRALAAAEPETRIVILVDALDEALAYSGPKSIVSLLAGMDALPDAVRFIVTTRPDRRVLRSLPPGCWQRSLSAPEEAANADADVRAFVEEHLLGNATIAERIAADIDPRRFIDLVSHKSAGNFQYLRHLATMLERRREAIDEDSVDALPPGLDQLYIADLERMLEGRPDAWPKRIRPFLGVLAIANESLTAAQLGPMVGVAEQDIGLIARDAEQFLDASHHGTRTAWALYHQSFADFLRDQRRAEEYWCDPAVHNARVVEAYRGDAGTWREADWDSIDDYALEHLAAHVREASDERNAAERLDALICEPMLRAIEARHGSRELFVRSVTYAMQVAEKGRVASRLPILIRQGALLATLRGIHRHVPPRALATLAATGHVRRALAYASLTDAAIVRVEALVEIALHVPDPGRSAELLERAIDVLSIERNPQTAASGFAFVAAAAARADQDALARRAAEAAIAPSLAIRASREITHLGSIGDWPLALQSLEVTLQSLALAGREDVAVYIVTESLQSEFFVELVMMLHGVLSARGLEQLADFVRHAVELNPGSTALEWTLCRLLAAIGDVEAARTSARRFEEASAKRDAPDYDVRSAQLQAAHLYAEAKCPAKAVEILRAQVDSSRAPDAARFATVAASLQAQDAVEEATTAFNLAIDVLRDGYAPAIVDGLTVIAQTLATCARQDEARSLAENALEIARQIDHDAKARAHALERAADALEAAGLRGRALEVAGDIPFAIGRDRVLVSLAREFVTHGEVDGAVEAGDAILRNADRASAFASIALRLSETGKRGPALEMAQRIPEPVTRAAVMAALALQAADAGDLARATELADRSIAQCEAIVEDDIHVRAMVAAAAALEQHGRHDEARRLAQAAHRAAVDVIDQEARARALSHAAAMLERVGSPAAAQATAELREAEEVVRHLNQNLSGPMIYYFEMVRDDAEAGRIDEALSRADQLDDWQRARGYAAVAEVLAQQSDARAPGVAARAWEHALALPIAERPDAISDALRASLALPAREPAGLVTEALATLNQLPTRSQRSAMANRLLEILVGAQIWEPAQSLAFDAVHLGGLNGRDAIFAAIEAMTPLLAAHDGGATLGRVWDTLLEADSWWDPARRSAWVAGGPGPA